VVHRGAAALGISKSAVSRTFVKESAQALAKLMSRSFAEIDLVAIYVDGIIVASHHIIAAVGVDAQGNKLQERRHGAALDGCRLSGGREIIQETARLRTTEVTDKRSSATSPASQEGRIILMTTGSAYSGHRDR
jgi:hypothetical protein